MVVRTFYVQLLAYHKLICNSQDYLLKVERHALCSHVNNDKTENSKSPIKIIQNGQYHIHMLTI